MHFVLMIGFAIVLAVFAIFLLVYGIYTAIVEKDIGSCFGMTVCFLAFTSISSLMFLGAYSEYQDIKPQNQVKILKQKISDAEKAYQKYLIDHPELKKEADE